MSVLITDAILFIYAVLWEGPAAIEECSDRQLDASKAIGKQLTGVQPKQLSPLSESDADPSSEDEYIAEEFKTKGKTGKVCIQKAEILSQVYSTVWSFQRPTRRLSISSESDSEMSDQASRVRRKKSPVPNSSRLKRKNQQSSLTPPPKRKKPAESSAADDPARKYCLGKLEELFRDIFLRYPHLRVEKDNGDDDNNDVHEGVKPEGDLTEEEKAILMNKSKQFATALEQCIYETYSEPDKQGRPSAGPKYKYVTVGVRLMLANRFYHVGTVSERFNSI